MTDYILISLFSYLSVVVSTPVIMKIAFMTKFLDYPSRDPLKIHRDPIPLLGGLAIVLAVFSSLLIQVTVFEGSHRQVFGIALSLVILFLMGLYDDYKGLSPKKRLMGQFIAALVVVVCARLTVNLVPNSVINTALTIFCLMAMINAMNLLDGMDGLATGTTLVAAVGFLFGFIMSDNNFGVLLSMMLIGVSAGFLIYNFNPAKIFLGDNGSTVLGFLLGILAVLFSSHPNSVEHLTVPILILIVPILDTGLTVFRRLKNRTPVFQGDRYHLYDQLIHFGFSQRQTTVLIYCLASFGALAAASLI